jgi:hypothetical protein
LSQDQPLGYKVPLEAISRQNSPDYVIAITLIDPRHLQIAISMPGHTIVYRATLELAHPVKNIAEMDDVIFRTTCAAFRYAQMDGDIELRPGKQLYIFPSQPHSRKQYLVFAAWISPVA